MGSWGTGSFDNDAAGDWTDQLVDWEDPDLSLIRKTLHYVVDLESTQYLEVDESADAIAASEVVAAMKSGDYSWIPYEEVATWVQQHTYFYKPELATLAVKAIQRVLTNSEEKELWEENEELFPEWSSKVHDLQSRLKA